MIAAPKPLAKKKSSDRDTRPTLVFDSSAGRPHPAYQDFLPHCSFSSHAPKELRDVPVDPHGFDVAWCFANQQTYAQNIHFGRIYGEGGKRSGDFSDWMFDLWRDLQPKTVIMASGHDDQDTQIGEMIGKIHYPPEWLDRFNEVRESCDTQVFFSAGNGDKNDADEDLKMPQRWLAGTDWVHAIGSCNADGVPSPFSGDSIDGRIFALYLGEECRVCDGVTGESKLFTGTSPAVGSAAGDAEANNLRGADLVEFVKYNATFPEGEFVRPHPKAGYGVMEWSRQYNLQQAGIQNRLEPYPLLKNKRP